MVNRDDGADGEEKAVVPVSRDDLKGLYRSTVVLVVVVVAAFAVAIWAWIREEAVNNDLRDLVEAEAHEEDGERARECVGDHGRYERFLQLARDLTEAGATVGTDAHLALLNSTPEERRAAHDIIADLLPGAVEPIIDRYPPPVCDLEDAERTLVEQDRRDEERRQRERRAASG